MGKSFLNFIFGLAVGVWIGLFSVSVKDDTPYPTPLPDTIVTTINDVRCYGYVAAPPTYVGIPPRLWICEDHPPWYDSTGKRFPSP